MAEYIPPCGLVIAIIFSTILILKLAGGIMARSFIREKKIYCGQDYLEVDIYSISENQLEKRKGKRSKKEKVSIPAQRNLNDKNARRTFNQLAETNFGENDYSVTLTYTKEFLPDTLEEAAKAGITAIIQPGGSIRDEDSIKVADTYGIAMVFTGVRHFKH